MSPETILIVLAIVGAAAWLAIAVALIGAVFRFLRRVLR